MKEKQDYIFRKATLDDRNDLNKLITVSSESINKKYYDSKIIQAAIGNIWIVDEKLILDRTYWLVENCDNQIIGCGGWSKRNLLFGNGQTTFDESGNDLLDNKKDPARIRAFFVHPYFTRKGIGKELLKICEAEAISNGFKSLELVATLSGVKLYSACGFIESKRIQINLGNGIFGEAIKMTKRLN